MRTAIVLFWLGSAISVRAHAEEGPLVRLSWVRGEGAEGCIDGEALARDVARRLGREPFGEPAAQRLEGLVVREGTRFVARLYERDASGALTGSRTIESEGADCPSLSSALGLAVALAIDPDAALAPAPAPAPGAAPAPAPDSSESPSPEPASESPARPAASGDAAAGTPTAASSREAGRDLAPPGERSPIASIGAALLLTVDLVPGLAPGMSIRADGVLSGPLHLTLGALATPEQRTDARTSADFGFSWFAARAGLSLVTAIGPLSLAVEVAGLVGSITAVVYSPIPAAPGGRLWGGLEVAGRLVLSLVGPLFAELAVGAIVPFVRHAFRVEGRTDVEFQEGPVVPVFSFGLGLHFG